MKLQTRILSATLAIFALLTFLPTGAVTVSAETYSGTCGDTLTWSLNTETGVLTISGTGAMTNYSWSNAPWYSYRAHISSIEFEETVTSIGNFAFYGLDALKSITIPDHITSIGHSVFRKCSQLSDVTIGKGITGISNFTFFECTALESITIPNHITSIGSAAFMSCRNLKNASIPSSVTTIGDHAFYDCVSLTNIRIPNGVTSLGYLTFSNCTSLQKVIYLGTEAEWNAIEKDNYWDYGTASYTVEYHTAHVYDEGVITTAPTFTSEGVKTYTCSCGLTYTEAIEKLIGGSCGTDLIWTFDKPSSTLTISGTGKMTDYYIPSNPPWYAYRTLIKVLVIEDGVTTLGYSAFAECTALTSVTIADSVTEIGNRAFGGCTNLISVTLPDAVKKLGDEAFVDCTRLSSVTLSKTLTEIGEGTFNNCKALKNIVIPDSVTSIGNAAFIASGLMRITLPSSLTSIGAWFQTCTSLQSFTVPEGITTIESGAFRYCYYLKTLYLPKTLTSIESYAFDVTGVKTIYFDGTKREWEAVAIGGNNRVLTTAAVIFQPCEVHTWDEGTVTVIPDGDTVGEMTYTCLDCEATKTEELIYRAGDANDDGTVDLNDAVLVKVYLANYDYVTNTSTITVALGADANADGTIDLNDAVLLTLYLANFDYNTGTSTVVLGKQGM